MHHLTAEYTMLATCRSAKKIHCQESGICGQLFLVAREHLNTEWYLCKSALGRSDDDPPRTPSAPVQHWVHIEPALQICAITLQPGEDVCDLSSMSFLCRFLFHLLRQNPVLLQYLLKFLLPNIGQELGP